MVDPSSIQGVLIDLDGVMYIDDDLIPGAVQAVEFLQSRGIAYRFATNTTMMPLDLLHEKLQRLGIPAGKGDIISPPAAAARYLRKQGTPSCHLVMMDETKRDFAEFPQTDESPDYVVIGKIGNQWDYALMNQLFHYLIDGAQLIALHKDRSTMGSDGLFIEFGAFIAGLEYASCKEALVIGKPSPAFFQSAFDSMGLRPEQVMMIGDDINSDVGGAQNAGALGTLVQTGKYRKETTELSPVKPDVVLASIAGLPEWFDRKESRSL